MLQCTIFFPLSGFFVLTELWPLASIICTSPWHLSRWSGRALDSPPLTLHPAPSRQVRWDWRECLSSQRHLLWPVTVSANQKHWKRIYAWICGDVVASESWTPNGRWDFFQFAREQRVPWWDVLAVLSLSLSRSDSNLHNPIVFVAFSVQQCKCQMNQILQYIKFWVNVADKYFISPELHPAPLC